MADDFSLFCVIFLLVAGKGYFSYISQQQSVGPPCVSKGDGRERGVAVGLGRYAHTH